MIHPIFVHLVRQPGLFLEHANAYADLASAEMDEWSQHWKQRSVLTVVAVLLALLGLCLGGVAGLIWAAVPLEQMPRPWLLWAIPLAFLLPAALTGWWAQRSEPPQAFAAVRAQAALDLATLQALDEEARA